MSCIHTRVRASATLKNNNNNNNNRGFSLPMKHNERQNRTTTTVKNPNWLEANQLAIYECDREVEPGTTRIKFNEWSERVLNPGSPDLKASALTTGRHCTTCAPHVHHTTLHHTCAYPYHTHAPHMCTTHKD